MRISKMVYFILFACFFLTACTTGFHGSFAPNSYIGSERGANSGQIGRVEGQSCQTKVLYLFPAGQPPSTAEAIQSAKGQIEGTKFLTDISIDDRILWEIGYSKQCIAVSGTAHR